APREIVTVTGASGPAHDVMNVQVQELVEVRAGEDADGRVLEFGVLYDDVIRSQGVRGIGFEFDAVARSIVGGIRIDVIDIDAVEHDVSKVASVAIIGKVNPEIPRWWYDPD